MGVFGGVFCSRMMCDGVIFRKAKCYENRHFAYGLCLTIKPDRGMYRLIINNKLTKNS